MKKQKITYRFHNPNSPEQTAESILEIVKESNAKKIEQAIIKAQTYVS